MKHEVCEVSRWQLLKQQLNNLKPEQFRRAMATQSRAILLDVRTKGEYEASHLSGARLLNYFDTELIDELERLDPEATYLVYCRSGRRSARVCTLMKNSGFNNVYNLEGGLVAWADEIGALV